MMEDETLAAHLQFMNYMFHPQPGKAVPSRMYNPFFSNPELELPS